MNRCTLAILMIAVYSIGLLHEIIPHCHHSEAGESTTHVGSHLHHQHQHLTGAHAQTADRSVVSNYHKKGFLDFVACLLSEAKHPASECSELHTYRTTRPLILQEDFDRSDLATSIIPFTAPTCKVLSSEAVPPASIQPRTSSELVNSPFRGPPEC